MTDKTKRIAFLILLLTGCFFLPVGNPRFEHALIEGLILVRWYTREYLFLTLVPAFLIAGAIGAFMDRDAVLRCLGAKANKYMAYGVAAVSGAIVAVCSCAVLPIFSGIHKKGAGLGPAITFLYSGPAINILAVILTARVLGIELGIARAVAAIGFSVVIGVLMHVFFPEDDASAAPLEQAGAARLERRHGAQTVMVFVAMIGMMLFMNWARAGDVRAVLLCCPGGLNTYEVEGQIVDQGETHVTILDTEGRELVVTHAEVKQIRELRTHPIQDALYASRWVWVAACAMLFALMLWRWFSAVERSDWLRRSWSFAARMLPALLIGVLAAGFFMGGHAGEGVIPRYIIEMLVGVSPEPFLAVSGIENALLVRLVHWGWAFWTNLFASTLGVLMYFATLTEVPIIRGLMRGGMGKGPALALLLAGPAISLPNMIVIRGIIGTRRTLAYVGLVVVMATLSGIIYGALM